MTNTTMTGAEALRQIQNAAYLIDDPAAGLRLHEAFDYFAGLQAKCDAMEADAKRFKYLAKAWSSKERISLEVAKQLTLGSVHHLQEAIDNALKAQEAEQAIERS